MSSFFYWLFGYDAIHEASTENVTLICTDVLPWPGQVEKRNLLLKEIRAHAMAIESQKNCTKSMEFW